MLDKAFVETRLRISFQPRSIVRESLLINIRGYASTPNKCLLKANLGTQMYCDILSITNLIIAERENA